MVHTRATTKKIELGQLPEDNAVVLSPAKKQRRDGVESFKKRHRGKPSQLCQLNLDVLFLLAEYVHPLDLLNLARTCKSLRALLMDKSSALAWKTARCQVQYDLPDCPADLTEPEYANLVFYARCHGCGKYVKKILWAIRRRYCPECRDGRLRRLSSCPDIIRNNLVLPAETLKADGAQWVDNEQVNSFMRDYNRSSDDKQFLSEKREQYYTIRQHAVKCEYWEHDVALERRYDLDSRRQERYDSMFENLQQHGYAPEITYFGRHEIQQSHKSYFNTSKPLTDKAWSQIWPELLETMNKFRSRRLEKTVYQPRRDLLDLEYATYVASPAQGTRAFDILPHVTDIARFPPFRDVIYAPEGAEMGAKPFDSAFAQLPVLVDEWKKQLDDDFAKLVKIPARLSFKHASGGRGVASSSAARMESTQAPTDKLRLACAVFVDNTVACYPELLSCLPVSDSIDYSEPNLSILDRFNVKFLEEAPYIVHACGLDPHVATAEDMDRRNARLKCLSCNDSRIMPWRDALLHARWCSPPEQTTRSKSPRCQWQIISDEHMDAIQTAELSLSEKPRIRSLERCLLCRPCVGEATYRDGFTSHFVVL
ncbi:hypothetical protein OG21DRAFT_848516 [Imleria badia]|nr:hypothetical protein OG21DRAFT_848516 [Imleria badia]